MAQPRGLHFHIGSQLFELEPFRAAVRAIASLGDFPVYNLGGGLAAAYTADQQPPSAERYVEAIVDAVHAELGPDKRLLLEPGRALVANSTVTLYTVQTIKRNVSTWVAVDGGMSDNLRPMMYGARYEAVIADRPLTAGDTVCHLAGKHCESGDVIVRDAACPTPRPATSSSPRRPGPTATRWPTTTTASRARRWCSSATARPASSCAARPTPT